MSEVKSERTQRFLNWVADDLELLARLHAVELGSEMIQQLSQGGFPATLVLKPSSDQPILPVMAGALEEIRSGGVSYDELAADFAAIYLNGAIGASPNESPWLDDDHLERQEPMFEVRKWYAKYNLEIENWRIRQDDNLSIQLMFIASLLRMPQPPLPDVATFMDHHLLRWVGKFADLVFSRADTAFYASLAVLTDRYLVEFREILAQAKGLPRPTAEQIEMAHRKAEEKAVFDPRFYSSEEGGW